MLLNLLKAVIQFFLEIFETAALAILIFLALYLFLVRPHQVRGDSMLPNFRDGEYLLTEMVGYNLLGKSPQRGDVVVFRSPEQPKLDFIKRVVGLPNEKIKIQNGDIFIVNSEHPEGFLLEENYLEAGTVTQGRKTIRDGELFSIGDGYVVFGDNRERSSDSREWGAIKKDSIVGRVWVRYWPPEVFRFIEAPTYGLNNRNDLFPLPLGKGYLTGFFSKNRKISPQTDSSTGTDARPMLADKNHSRQNFLTTSNF